MWLFLKKNQGWHPCPSTSRLNSSSCFSSRCRNNGEQGRQKQEIALIRDPLPMSGNGACYSPFLPSVGTAESEANVTSAFKCGQSISQPIGQWQPFRHSSYYRKWSEETHLTHLSDAMDVKEENGVSSFFFHLLPDLSLFLFFQVAPLITSAYVSCLSCGHLAWPAHFFFLLLLLFPPSFLPSERKSLYPPCFLFYTG